MEVKYLYSSKLHLVSDNFQYNECNYLVHNVKMPSSISTLQILFPSRLIIHYIILLLQISLYTRIIIVSLHKY